MILLRPSGCQPEDSIIHCAATAPLRTDILLAVGSSAKPFASDAILVYLAVHSPVTIISGRSANRAGVELAPFHALIVTTPSRGLLAHASEGLELAPVRCA